MTPPPESGGGRRPDVLAALRASSVPSSIADIAAQLRLHPNTVRFHLEALIAGGQAERVDLAPAGPGRPPQMFRAHPGMDQAGPRNYRLLADILTAQLAAEPDHTARAVEAGRAWGRRLIPPPADGNNDPRRAVEDLVRVLDDLGFAPQSDTPTRPTRIRLRHCPFLDMAASRTAVVCPVHLGLMRGVLEAGSAPITVGRLEPFAEPDLCLAHLTAAGPSDTTTTGSDT